MRTQEVLSPVVMMPLESLRAHPENATIFGDPTEATQYEEIRDSIKKHGVWEPLVVNSDGKILSGHLRAAALKELGKTEAPCRVMSFDTYRSEAEFIVRSNTDRRHLTPEQKAYAFDRLRKISKEEGGTKRKVGRPENAPGKTGKSGKFVGKSRAGAGDSKHDPAAEDAAEAVGIKAAEARALQAVFVNTDVPHEVKAAVNNGKVAPTPAAEMVKSERKRQGGEIKDPEPLKAWVQKKSERKPEPPDTDESTHGHRIAVEAECLKRDVGSLLEVYTRLDDLLRKRPLKSVVGPSEHQRYASLIRDIAVRASDELASVEATESIGRQLKLTAIKGGRS